MFLQAVQDYLALDKAYHQFGYVKPSVLRHGITALYWLTGETQDGVTLETCAQAIGVDVRRLYRAPYLTVISQLKALKRGRRRMDDYQ